jgi:hypothetical protein
MIVGSSLKRASCGLSRAELVPAMALAERSWSRGIRRRRPETFRALPPCSPGSSPLPPRRPRRLDSATEEINGSLSTRLGRIRPVPMVGATAGGVCPCEAAANVAAAFLSSSRAKSRAASAKLLANVGVVSAVDGRPRCRFTSTVNECELFLNEPSAFLMVLADSAQCLGDKSPKR